MPKELPVIAQAAIDTGWWKWQPAFIITLGDGSVLKYSTINQTVGAHTFVNRLKYAGPLKQSLNSSPDNVSFDLWNADSAAGLAFVDPVTALDGAQATYYRVLGNTVTGDKDLIEEISGFLEIDPGAGAGDEKVTFTLLSDSGLSLPVVANVPVLAVCPYRYDHVTGADLCTYVGAIPTCDKTFDGPNGCSQHFGYEGARDRFGGHSRDLDPVTIQTYKPPTPPTPVVPNPNPFNGGGGRFPVRYPDDDFPYCVTPETMVLRILRDFHVWEKAGEVEEGDYLMNASGGSSLVTKVMRGTTTRLHVITTDNNKQLWCTPSHPILKTDNEEDHKPAAHFNVGDSILTYENGNLFISRVAAIEIIETPFQYPVVIFQLAGEHTFISGGIVSHNIKPFHLLSY